MLFEPVRTLRLRRVQEGLLRSSAPGLQIVQSIFVGFETNDLYDAWAALSFILCGQSLSPDFS